MLPQQTTVLVVGAGPTGLAAATSLAFQGCKDLVIVDAVERSMRPLSSRALAVHAATLEVLDTIQVADDLVEHGIKAKCVDAYTPSGPLSRVDFTSLKGRTRYPFVMLVSQYTTERVLEKKAEEQGIKVERPYRLVGLSDDEDKDGLIVATFDNGERIKAKYIIAADGARSAVRQLVNVGFADPDGASIDDKDVQQMVMADVTFTSTPPCLARDEFFGYLAYPSFYISIPLPRSRYPESYESTEDNLFRIGFNVPKEEGQPPPFPDVEYFQQYLDRIQPSFLYPNKGEESGIKIDKMLWSARFRTHAAIADKFLVQLHAQNKNQDNPNPRVVFLIGDAAHIHSPIGGQGMNLGLRDAIGLAPVLVKHMELFPQDPSAADKLLEEYASTRYDRAVGTIRLTKRSMNVITSLGAMSSSWAWPLLWIISLVFKVPFVTGTMVWEMSGLGRV
ncbi:hypothetical protein F5887DRAFT_1178537 [Amanita rubescens]|nr:hypothetical protein F5887DRAFT_1178537 [Amanita rubescens]